MKYWFVLAVLALAMAGTECIVCTENFCATVQCLRITEADCCKKGQIFVENGGTCGCCNVCLTVIKKGGSCQSLQLSGGPAPTAECQKGTTCTDVGNSTFKCK